MKIVRWLILGLIVVGVIAVANGYWLRQGIVVDVASVTRGALIESLSIQGVTQATDFETLIAPTAGQLERITWRSGDAISKDSILATINPPISNLLDVRSEKLAKSRVLAAESELRRAELTRDAADVNLKQVQKRKTSSTTPNTQPRPTTPDLEAEEQSRKLELEAAGYAVDRARYELEAARAQLGSIADDSKSEEVAPSTDDDAQTNFKEAPDTLDHEQKVVLRSPIRGHILRVLRRDAGVVAPGTPLLELGDLDSLEFAFEVVTDEAVQLKIGTRVEIGGWGTGENSIMGSVVRIDRSANRRISSLGVEEHTVSVSVKANENHNPPAGLGHGFKIEGRFLIRETPDALKVPIGALFRENGEWYVFRVQKGLAFKTRVEVGSKNDQDFSIKSGLADYDLVVLFPANRIQNGQAVKLR